MKALKNHLILFDADCPMCNIYTLAFVRTGMLEKDGRAAYQQFPQHSCPMLDRQRAVDEIALVNRQTGEVTYGVESLFTIFSTSYPLLKPLFSFAPFVWLMKKCYAFVSHNRRVIIPAPAEAHQFKWQPTFKLKYRLAYLFITWLITSIILSHYVSLLPGFVSNGSSYREYFVCGGQLFFQGAVISLTHRTKRWEYLGNMMTISFAGALLLLPAIISAGWLNFPPFVYAGWFMVVAGFMLLEHIRRSRLLLLGSTLTLTWIIYRLIILLVIFLINQ